MQVLQGDAISVLQKLPKESVDVVYTCPSPFGYYEKEEESLIGGEKELTRYVEDLVVLVKNCEPVLKSTGSLFIQLGDQFTPQGYLAGIPIFFEMLMRGTNMLLNDRLIWHRIRKLKNYKDKGFFKNYEFIFHYVKSDNFYFNERSKYAMTSIYIYPLEDSYNTNEFDSGLPEQLFRMVINTCCPENGVTMDPLCGSAKLGVVAKKMNRDFIGIDINQTMVELSRIRLGLDQ